MSNVDKGTIKQRTIDRIRSGKLIGRLQKFALSNPTDPDYEKHYMLPHQIAAARILIAKVVPDLKQLELKVDGVIQVNRIERAIVHTQDADSSGIRTLN